MSDARETIPLRGLGGDDSSGVTVPPLYDCFDRISEIIMESWLLVCALAALLLGSFIRALLAALL